MAETFNFKCSAIQSGEVGFNVKSASFGDGYSQAAANGINNRANSWQVSIVGMRSPECENITDIDEVMTFLNARGGWESFLWTPPTGVQSKYICNGYSPSKVAGIWTINATFQEVFR